MFPRSIRSRIVLVYVAILAAALSLFGAILYHNYARVMYEDLDDLLLSRAEGVADSISTYFETDTWDDNNVHDLSFVKNAQLWVGERSKDPKLIDIVVQISDLKGNTIAVSKNMPKVLPIPEDAIKFVLGGESCFYDFTTELGENKQARFRAYAMAVMEDDKVTCIAQVASPTNSTETALAQLRTMLFILIPLTVLFTGLTGFILVKMALSPVDSMTKTIRQITAENLKARLKIPDTKDEINRLSDTFNDMLERLDKAFTSQQQFIQDISHELRTPLTIIKGELEVTLKKVRSPEEYEESLLSNLEEVDKIGRIVENLLTLARFENRQIKLDKKPFNLNALAGKTIDDLKMLAKAKAVLVGLVADADITIEGDEAHLRRLLINLLDNAIKYTHENGRVSISLKEEGARVVIKVSDTGIGIPKDDLRHVFDRFYRAATPHSDNSLGLGLSIVRSIARAHEGSVTVESEFGQGTTVTVLLPRFVPA